MPESKPRIGFIGCFQNGKSTALNCFLENRFAVSGEGVAKTKRVVRYVYGEKTGLALIDKKGSRRTVDQKTFLDETTREVDDGAVGEATICASILREVDLIDTPGFDASQKDVDATTAEIPNFDFVFFVVGGTRGNFNQAEKEVLRALYEFDKPFSILYNCLDLNAWSPNDELVAFRIRELESALFNCGIEPRVVRGRSVFPVNLAWRWRAIVMRGVDENASFYKETEEEGRIERQISSYFEDSPTSDALNVKSNFDWVYDYVAAPVNVIGIVKNSIPTPRLTIRLDDRQATASWNFIDANYAYEFSWRKRQSDDKFWTTFETRENKLTIDKLENGTEYEFRIRAVSNDRRSVSPFYEIRLVTPPRKVRVRITSDSDKRGLLDF